VKLVGDLENVNYADDDEALGGAIITQAIEYPIRQIANNAGYKGDWVVEEVKKNTDFNYGFNAATGEFTNLLEAGIIDPAKVERVALEHAVSSAAMLLTTDCVIANKPDPQ